MSLLIIRLDGVKALVLFVLNRDVCAWICFSCPLSRLPFLSCYVWFPRQEKKKYLKLRVLVLISIGMFCVFFF